MRRLCWLMVVAVSAVSCDAATITESPTTSRVSNAQTVTTVTSTTTAVDLEAVTSFDEPLFAWWWEDFSNPAVPFEVSEAAVAAGLCEGGLVTGDAESEKSPTEWSWDENEFRCFDGSGAWTQRIERRLADSERSIDGGWHEVGIWRIIDATGGYAGLRGGGIYECDGDPGYPHCEVWGEFRPSGDGSPPGEVGLFYARAGEWFVSSVGRPGVGLVLEASRLGQEPIENLLEQFEYLSGRLVWSETVIEPLCNVEIREARGSDEYVWIGEPFLSGGPCPEWKGQDPVRKAFQEYGLPEKACLEFSFAGVEHEQCGEFSRAANAHPETTATPSTSTTTSPSLVKFAPREIGGLSFTSVEWGAMVEEGVGGVGMVVKVRPLGDEPVQGLAGLFTDIDGSLVWSETVIDDLCGITITEVREDFVWIGDGFTFDESCPDWPDPNALRHAFDDYGLPEEGCIFFTFDGVEYELCEPLT